MKKFINYHIIIISITLLWAGLNSSCKKALEVPAPSGEIAISKSFSDSLTATAAVVSIYGKAASILAAEFQWGGVTLKSAQSADEVSTKTGNGVLETNSLNAQNLIENTWISPYQTIYQINQCIEGLNNYAKLSTTLKNQLLGECYFSRAYWYFYIFNTWGTGAMLTTTTDLQFNKLIANNSTREDFYNLMVTDLKQAQSLLVDAYPSIERVRPNRMAATALLARVYLYLGRYQEAIDESSKVINAGIYTLPALSSGTPNAPFLKASTETLWQIRVNSISESVLSKGNTPDGGNFAPLSPIGQPPYTLTPGLLTSFETGDQRSSLWVGTALQITPFMQFKYPYKYRVNITTGAPPEYYVCLRAAEQYLIRAEAYAQLNMIPQAIADINVVRARARAAATLAVPNPLPALDANGMSKATCMAKIEAENRHEFFCEWGHRWFDLKRWSGVINTSITRADEVLGQLKPTWKPNQKLYPVPANQLIYDPNLKQNPGY